MKTLLTSLLVTSFIFASYSQKNIPGLYRVDDYAVVLNDNNTYSSRLYVLDCVVILPANNPAKEQMQIFGVDSGRWHMKQDSIFMVSAADATRKILLLRGKTIIRAEDCFRVDNLEASVGFSKPDTIGLSRSSSIRTRYHQYITLTSYNADNSFNKIKHYKIKWRHPSCRFNLMRRKVRNQFYITEEGKISPAGKSSLDKNPY